MSHPWKPRHDNGKPDHRYSVRLEFCGQPRQQWVARFCDEWLGRDSTFAVAAEICHAHHRERMAGLV